MPTTYNSLIRTPSPLVVALLPKRQQLDGSACSSWESLVGFDARVSCGSTGRKPCGLTRRGVSRFISCVRLRNRHACSLPFARTTRRPTLEPSTSAILSEACSETLFGDAFLDIRTGGSCKFASRCCVRSCGQAPLMPRALSWRRLALKPSSHLPSKVSWFEMLE